MASLCTVSLLPAWGSFLLRPMTTIEQKIYDILLEKQSYLREKKGINEVYFGTEYVKRICDHNGYSHNQVINAMKTLRQNGYIVAKNRKEQGDWIYDYYTINGIKQSPKETPSTDTCTYTYHNNFREFTISIAA